ncbi:hypothetical protein VQ042_01390 [Aurantimonas sp. A2-1-M11]|uniref:hypothetical protein n=1 Tax=Aurantimonas sp. A2-1-M11 TaxID=3113712 RepID=UPI002F95332C
MRQRSGLRILLLVMFASMASSPSSADVFDEISEAMYNSILRKNCGRVATLARSPYFDPFNDYNGNDLLELAVSKNVLCAVRLFVDGGRDKDAAFKELKRVKLCQELDGERREMFEYLYNDLGAKARMDSRNVGLNAYIADARNLKNYKVCEKYIRAFYNSGNDVNEIIPGKCGRKAIDLLMSARANYWDRGTIVIFKIPKALEWSREPRNALAGLLRSMGSVESRFELDKSYRYRCPGGKP